MRDQGRFVGDAPKQRMLFLLFLLALSLRVGYLGLVWRGPLGNADSPAYAALATTISDRSPYQVYANAGPGGFPADLQRPPGYPAFLSLVNPAGKISRHRTAVVQCVIGALFVVVVAVMAGQLTNATLGVVAGLFYATDWVSVLHTPMLIPETAYTAVLGVAVLLFAKALESERDMLAAIAGAILGIAALTKPAAQVVLLAFFVAWFFKRPRRLRALVFSVTYLSCVLPWMVRNEHKYGVATISAIDVVDLYFYTAEGSLHSFPVSDFAGNAINADVSSLDRKWQERNLDLIERRRQMAREALRLITSHWPAVLKQTLIGFVHTCVGTGFVTVSDSLRAPPSRMVRLSLAVFPLGQVCLLWAMAIYGLVNSRHLGRPAAVCIVASIFCILVPASSPLSQSRFRVPAVPFLAVLAAMGTGEVKFKLLARRQELRKRLSHADSPDLKMQWFSVARPESLTLA